MLLCLYKALVLSKLFYSSPAYGNLALLDPVHHTAFRICTGTFRTTPVESLFAESGIRSLSDQHLLDDLKYWFCCRGFIPLPHIECWRTCAFAWFWSSLLLWPLGSCLSRSSRLGPAARLFFIPWTSHTPNFFFCRLQVRLRSEQDFRPFAVRLGYNTAIRTLNPRLG